MKAVALSLTVNDAPVSALVHPRTHLADFLREQLHLTGTHLGCEHGVCGSCTVLVDEVPIRGCITYAVAADGAQVRTIEGFSGDQTMADLRSAFTREHALQCGFCTPGMLITARDIVTRLGNVDDETIRAELAGNLCRCTGYRGIVRAVKAVAAQVAQSTVPPIAPSLGEKLAAFTPVPLTTTPAATPSRSEVKKDHWTHFTEDFSVRASVHEVWNILADFPVVASCLPGAEIGEYDQTSVKGQLRVKIGPISAAFAGAATMARDESEMTARIVGAGNDSASRSRTRGELTYRLREDTPGLTIVSLDVRYDLQGMLGQFSRSGLAQEVGRRMITEFSSNLDTYLHDRNGWKGASKPLGASKIVGSAVWNKLRAFLGLRSAP
jgi:carbon-monoxide dehydrogenase small subunit